MRAPCVVEGCDRPNVGLGLCSMHWQRQKRRGGLGSAAPERIHGDLTLVFLSRTLVDAHGCFLWTGAKAKGYGHLRYQDKDHQAHVLAYTLVMGPVPDGHVLDHECHNLDLTCRGGECHHRAYWNPEHVIPRTTAENLARGRPGGPKRSERCVRCGADDWYVHAATGTRACRVCQKRRSQMKRKGVVIR